MSLVKKLSGIKQVKRTAKIREEVYEAPLPPTIQQEYEKSMIPFRFKILLLMIVFMIGYFFKGMVDQGEVDTAVLFVGLVAGITLLFGQRFFLFFRGAG